MSSLALLLGGVTRRPGSFPGKAGPAPEGDEEKEWFPGKGGREGGRSREPLGEEEEERDSFGEWELEVLQYTLFLPFTLPVVAVEDPGLQEKGKFLPGLWGYQDLKVGDVNLDGPFLGVGVSF